VRSDGPSCVAGMGTGVDTASDEESHWKLNPVSLQYDAADMTDGNNFGMALEANRQVLLVHAHHTPETLWCPLR